jgi:hypothetical protein
LTGRIAVVAVLVLMLPPRAVAADKQIKPFVGVALGGNTTFIDSDVVVASPHGMIGVSTVVLGDLVGVDVDVALAPGFFTGERRLVISSSVLTVTGNVVITLPRRLTEYFLRPYFIGGAGVMRVNINDSFDAIPVGETLATFDVGGGVTGMLTNRTGVSWELRNFRSFGRDPMLQGISFGPERLSFWRATMALAVRY